MGTIRTPLPFSWSPSQAVDGNDGNWSTFVVRVGTPNQDFKVLFSTTSQETWVPVPAGCAFDPSNCPTLRGVLPFNNQPSEGFEINAVFELGLEENLNLTGNGEYGFDMVGADFPNSGGLTLENQVVAGIAAKSFMLGVFGLGPRPTNFTNFQDTHPSFLASLKDNSMIPSNSYGYTAGAYYRLDGVVGSLTLGGYDASRFVANDINLTFPMNPDPSIALTIGVQGISASSTLSGNVSILFDGILSFIDSTVPEIWLPESACTIFEQAFGLQLDLNTSRYLVNDTVHSNLLSLNPTITFKLGSTVSRGSTIDITLPYKAFDLQAKWPIYPNATNYFPLRIAADETYVIADYERSNFSVSQCQFADNATSQLIAIQPINATTTTVAVPDLTSKRSTAMIVGITVAVMVVLLLLVAGAYFYYQAARKKKENSALEKRQREERDAQQKEVHVHEVHEVDISSPNELHDSIQISELRGTRLHHELQGGDVRAELPAEDVLA